MNRITRRSVMAGSAAAVAVVPAVGLSLDRTPGTGEDDTELKALWAEWVETWTALQDAYPKEHQARCAAYKDKKRLRPVYYYEHLVPADARARRRWVAIERLHPLAAHSWRQTQQRRRAIPGFMSCKEAIAFAKQRLSAEWDIHRERCAEIRARHGVDVCEAECQALRDRLGELRKAIKQIPATGIFGVGVRLVAGMQWDDDHHETFSATLETVGTLSGTQFRLPAHRV
jgi:hypothetical protein